MKSTLKFKGNFSASCNSQRLEGSTLHAKCKRENGMEQDANINLNVCITNNNGALHWQANGNFIASSQECSLSGGKMLSCKSKNLKQALEKTVINLDEQVDNANGTLWCNNNPATKTAAPITPTPALTPVPQPAPVPIKPVLGPISVPAPVLPIVPLVPAAVPAKIPLAPQIIGKNTVTPIIPNVPVAPLGVKEGNFSLTCKDHRLELSHLHAHCQKANGEWHRTKINLNKCLSNVDGVLHWRLLGNYHETSRCRLVGHHLHCESKKKRWKRTT